MNSVPQNLPHGFSGDLLMLKLAREIAMEIRPFEDILQKLQITPQDFNQIATNPRFQQLLAAEMADWHSAGNTPERVKLRAAAMIEEALPEFFECMIDKQESLNAKVETAKMITRLAGLGNDRAATEGGERFSLTINVGEGVQRTISVNSRPVIEHDDEEEFEYQETLEEELS